MFSFILVPSLAISVILNGACVRHLLTSTCEEPRSTDFKSRWYLNRMGLRQFCGVPDVTPDFNPGNLRGSGPNGPKCYQASNRRTGLRPVPSWKKRRRDTVVSPLTAAAVGPIHQADSLPPWCRMSMMTGDDRWRQIWQELKSLKKDENSVKVNMLGWDILRLLNLSLWILLLWFCMVLWCLRMWEFCLPRHPKRATAAVGTVCSRSRGDWCSVVLLHNSAAEEMKEISINRRLSMAKSEKFTSWI